MPKLEEINLGEGILSIWCCIYDSPWLKETIIPESVAEIYPINTEEEEWPKLQVYRGSYAEKYFQGNKIPVNLINREEPKDESTAASSLWLLDNMSMSDIRSSISNLSGKAKEENFSLLDWMQSENLLPDWEEAESLFASITDSGAEDFYCPAALEGDWVFSVNGKNSLGEACDVDSAGTLKELKEIVRTMESCTELTIARVGTTICFSLVEEKRLWMSIDYFPESNELYRYSQVNDTFPNMYLHLRKTIIPNESDWEGYDINISSEENYDCSV